jgi:hypothetical protein
LYVSSPRDGKAVLPVADARRHRQEVAQRDLPESGISRRQLGQVLGHPIVDASDQSRVERDPDQRRHERLGGGERGLQALARSAPQVALEHEAVFVDDEKRERVRLVQELVESLPFAAHGAVGLDAGRKGTRASTRPYRPRREPRKDAQW